MGRRKIEIKPIKDDRNRSVTFLKRKGGLFKKAHELSVLCQVDVAVVIFSSNKKLYQYCSGDINEIITRHSYYEAPHESKGPADFQGKKDLDDDDDDDALPGPERAASHSSNDHPLPPHMQHPSLHLNRHTASASPPNMSKTLVGPPGYPMGPRVGTPQPMTRPSSRNQVGRRNSSNLVPPNGYPATQHPPHQNGYPSYMSHQHQQHPHQPHQPHQHQPHQHQQHQQHQPPPPVYSSQMMQPSMQYPQYAPPPPQNAQPQQSDSFLNDPSRRQSMPPVFNAEQPAPENEQPPREPQSLEPKRAPTKSRSMYTPIGPSDSVLAQHFGLGQGPRAHSIDSGALQKKNGLTVKTEEKAASAPAPPVATTAPPPPPPPPPQPLSTSPPPPPLSRNNSMADPKSAGIRPKLKVMIPSENSDAGSPSASPRGPLPNPGTLSARPGDDGAPGVVLPPPSPSQSVGALLSAGAQGPDNPFSRRLRPEQTPISALPSRFAESILASPSGSFYNEWMGGLGMNQRGSDNMLPSPLNFQSLQTPVGGSSAPFFKSEFETNGNKRRSPESDHSEGSAAKRPKNS